MTDEISTPTKGRGKREISPPPVEEAAPRPSRPLVPKVVRRHRHRRRNVAASVWGPQIPMAPHYADGTPFNVYKALLRHPNLFFQFAIRLPTTTLTDLYAIDKEFHYRFNKYSVSIIAEHASYLAPKVSLNSKTALKSLTRLQAAYIFSWILFPELCISDPMLRPMDGRPHLARDIPSLRWSKMVEYRNGVVRGILTDMGIQGLRVPKGTHVALMKFWLLMEMKAMAIRTAFLSDKRVWTDDDILCFLHFLSKLDMCILHPVFVNGMCSLSHMMLTQKSLTPLYHLLIGSLALDYDDASDMMIRTYMSEDLDTDTHTWLDDEIDNGIPEEEWGLLCREGWDMYGERLEPAVNMVMMESIRRDLNPQRYLLDWALYGFFDYDRMENIPAPRKWRREQKVHVPTDPWPREQGNASLTKWIGRSGLW
jgi:hypothetical protein